MRSGASKIVFVVVAVTAGLVFAAGAAIAVSGGGYNPDQQNCPANADNSGAPSDPSATSPGCHNFAVNVESGGTTNGDANSNNTRYAEWGNHQSPHIDHNPSSGFFFNVGDPGTPASPHSGCLAANTDGTGGGTGTGCGNNPNGAGFSATYDYYQLYCPATAALPLNSVPVPDGVPAAKNCDPKQPIGNTGVTPDTGTGTKLYDLVTNGFLVYVGADDNLDNGEHDGFTGVPGTSTDGAINGPSDGGAITLSMTPQNAANSPSGHNPEGLVNFSTGLCADGICGEATTQQQTVYHGCNAPNTPNDACAPGTPQNGNVYENGAPSSRQESPNCQSGSPDNANPGPPGTGPCFTNADGSANPNGPNGYRQTTPNNMNAQPGVQTYQDPDPQRSPVAPVGTPGVYAGTCGLYLNDGGGSVAPGITGLNPGYIVPGAC
jgi:hypothetical protein